jgi:glycosyltransferase involved in cell wall biosynthesis
MKICIIIPLFNEASRFDTSYLIDFSSKNNIDFCLVNDGSTDTTSDIINNLEKSQQSISSINLKHNKGKGEAIRTAVKHLAKKNAYDYIGYFDADFATPLNEVNNFTTEINRSKKTFIMGIRLKRIGANITRFKSRHYFGRVVASIISEFILKLPTYDTQCGAKLIESNLAKELFEKPFKTKWLFDVELIARMQQIYGKEYCLNNIVELPLNTWVDKGDSRITFLDFLKTPFNLLKLYAVYQFRK